MLDFHFVLCVFVCKPLCFVFLLIHRFLQKQNPKTFMKCRVFTVAPRIPFSISAVRIQWLWMWFVCVLLLLLFSMCVSFLFIKDNLSPTMNETSVKKHKILLWLLWLLLVLLSTDECSMRDVSHIFTTIYGFLNTLVLLSH